MTTLTNQVSNAFGSAFPPFIIGRGRLAAGSVVAKNEVLNFSTGGTVAPVSGGSAVPLNAIAVEAADATAGEVEILFYRSGNFDIDLLVYDVASYSTPELLINSMRMHNTMIVINDIEAGTI